MAAGPAPRRKQWRCGKQREKESGEGPRKGYYIVAEKEMNGLTNLKSISLRVDKKSHWWKWKEKQKPIGKEGKGTRSGRDFLGILSFCRKPSGIGRLRCGQPSRDTSSEIHSIDEGGGGGRRDGLEEEPPSLQSTKAWMNGWWLVSAVPRGRWRGALRIPYVKWTNYEIPRIEWFRFWKKRWREVMYFPLVFYN